MSAEFTPPQPPTLLCQCAQGHRWAYVVNVCPECSGAAVNEYAMLPAPPTVRDAPGTSDDDSDAQLAAIDFHNQQTRI